MSLTVMLLLVISVGIGAYVKARQGGLWSWRLFAKTLLWLAAMGGSMGLVGIWLRHLVGPEHAWVTTIGVVAVIVAGVVFWAIWMGGKRGQGGEGKADGDPSRSLQSKDCGDDLPG